MRILNRLAAIVLALLLLGAGALIAAETALIWLNRPPVLVPRDSWYQALSGTSVGDAIVLIVSIGVLTAGIVILFLQLRPWRPVRLPANGTGWYLRRRSAQRSLAAAVERLPAVASVRARLGRNWRLRLRAAADSQDRDAVREAALGELGRLAAADTSRLRLRLTRRRVV